MIGAVRRSQLITTYGVGAIVAVEDDSVMVAGLDHWPAVPSSSIISEPRLYVEGKHLRLPPGGDSEFGEPGFDIPVVRFPRWYYCSNPECRRLDTWGRLSQDRKSHCKHCGWQLVPSRFVAICSEGHIEDFPYWHWIHAGHETSQGDRHELALEVTGSSGSLAGIVVKCRSCELERSLDGAFDKSALVGVKSCGGHLPWLGRETVDCGKRLRTTQRGASNVWFAQVRSALSIPPWSDGVQQFVNRYWTTLKQPLDGATLEKIAATLIADSRLDFSPAEVLTAVNERRGIEAGEKSDQEIRSEEFGALSRGRPEDPRATFVAEPAAPPRELSEELDLVTVVKRLREVRVFTGFTRLTPALEEDAVPVPIATDAVDWLPAIPVNGEGVFLRLNDRHLAAWENSPDVGARVDLINARWAQSFFNRGEPVTTRFLVAHVFAHAVINQWALAGGYPAASLRERVYAEEDGTGVLIYTAAADSAGSLGGVIAQADPDRLRISIAEAVRRFAWCSSDPVCSETQAQGAEGLNLAACHACALLPETSCEWRNGLLDRALLVGLPGHRDFGLFGRLVED